MSDPGAACEVHVLVPRLGGGEVLVRAGRMARPGTDGFPHLQGARSSRRLNRINLRARGTSRSRPLPGTRSRPTGCRRTSCRRPRAVHSAGRACDVERGDGPVGRQREADTRPPAAAVRREPGRRQRGVFLRRRGQQSNDCVARPDAGEPAELDEAAGRQHGVDALPGEPIGRRPGRSARPGTRLVRACRNVARAAPDHGCAARYQGQRLERPLPQAPRPGDAVGRPERHGGVDVGLPDVRLAEDDDAPGARRHGPWLDVPEGGRTAGGAPVQAVDRAPDPKETVVDVGCLFTRMNPGPPAITSTT